MFRFTPKFTFFLFLDFFFNKNFLKNKARLIRIRITFLNKTAFLLFNSDFYFLKRNMSQKFIFLFILIKPKIRLLYYTA